MEVSNDTWLWIIIQDPGKNEMLLGQYDEKKDISFIPAFPEKDSARASLEFIHKDSALKYDIQAIKYVVLEKYARDNGFVVFVCNAAGEILSKPMG